VLNVNISIPVIFDTTTTANAVKADVAKPQAATPNEFATSFILFLPRAPEHSQSLGPWRLPQQNF
jgi:hypothetical protein